MKVATLALILHKDRILLGEKKSGAEIGSGTLNGPGGKCEPGESPLACVMRETYEEVGLTLDSHTTEETATITFYAAGVRDFQVHVFRTESFTGTPTETEEMIPYWFPADNLPFERMLESDREWFTRAVRGEQFNANVYYAERAKGFERIEYLIRSGGG